MSIRSKGVTLIPYADHDEWLSIRRKYIGGSDAGAIIGMNPYSSAFSVWAEKTGKVPEFEGNVSTKVGNQLEDFVAHMFMEETGKKVQRCNFTIVNQKYPFACANIDREVLGEDSILEIKTTNSFVNTKKFLHGEYPEQWYAQMTHYLAVTGAQKCYLAVLSECRDFRIFELELDEEEIKALMDAERIFWNEYVIPQKMPAADGHSATTDTIKRLFSEEAGDDVSLTDFSDAFQQRKHLNEQIKNLKAELDGIDNRIKSFMGSHSSGTCGRFKVTWKLQKTSALDRDAIKADYPSIDFDKYKSQSRVFRVTESKEKTA